MGHAAIPASELVLEGSSKGNGMSTTLPPVTEGLAVGGRVDVLGRVGQELQDRIRPGGLKPDSLIEVVVVGQQDYDLDPTRSFDGKRFVQY